MNKLFLLLFLVCQCVFSQNNLTHEVYFETDKYVVPVTEENRLLLFISTLSDTDIESIAIYGFCDDIGASEYNLKLSQDRADAIKAIFANNEISESLITNVDGKGEILLKIVNEKNILKIRGLNRKVEIIVTPKPPKTVEEKKTEAELDEKKKGATEKIKGKLKIGDKILFENILFKTGYSVLMPESKPIIQEIAESLLERKDIYFTIQGHVCCTQYSRDAVDRKTKKRNLSVARAKYVYDYFVKKGINPKRMKYVGLRRLFPLGGDPKDDRRVEILITYVKEP
ncbi:MAG: OmpA family protein [Flavobacteriales bacterium]|nr:OmpA family protein [Flavobacteriia bacterium]NCP06523.1 OmpA family protein [Flavobacteriales bacterium]PIV93867.1 MAG: flagellar motor protein MotB [Flavobacteriaceae bacterium CG17_big_fil_post_rev_8_21_14_2_50_33_15]PIY09366.1 MAG: flagellar motor protein MotB [Flavobacteriaceae bacterium CG_4_10_14_3_um_filter_33_47]PJB17666.1 MAG: flagellar motor protein MotB [Flavobacteriaceae bacterium CG_4_9_14_3_um_filter_33_16]